MMKQILRIAIFILCIFSIACAAEDKQDTPSQFQPEYGWEWVIEPKPATSSSLSSRGILAIVDMDQYQGLVVALAYPASFKPLAPIYRPVIFDSENNRYELTSKGSSGNEVITMALFRHNPAVLQTEMVKYLGVEMLTGEGRHSISKRAANSDLAKRIQVLPFPDIGEPYEFQLETMEGTQISAASLKGRVIVVDCWATWCRPCMEKMPKLKALYEELGSAKLAIVGVNFDDKQEEAISSVESLEIDWPQIYVQPDEDIWNFWNDVATVLALPRIFVIDHKGILRGDVRPYEIENMVRELVSKAKEQPSK